jgi:hypothetical protein
MNTELEIWNERQKLELEMNTKFGIKIHSRFHIKRFLILKVIPDSKLKNS